MSLFGTIEKVDIFPK